MKKIWIVWEKHRRSTNLAREFNCKLFNLKYNLPRTLEYPFLILKTLKIIMDEKPDILFVQNPSFILTLFVLLLRSIIPIKKVIVDSHYSIAAKGNTQKLRYPIKYHIKNADITIVTNKAFQKLVEINGGKAFILPDKIPEFKKKRKKNLKGTHNILYIGSGSYDEPYSEIIKAAKLLSNKNILIYLTGNLKKFIKLKSKQKNYILTGYLSETDYISMLYSVDLIIDLTKLEDCLVCGAYEAVAAEKPLITSNTRALKEYFDKGAIYVENNPKSIAEGIKKALKNKQKLIKQIKILKKQRNKEWKIKFDKFKKIIENA